MKRMGRLLLLALLLPLALAAVPRAHANKGLQIDPDPTQLKETTPGAPCPGGPPTVTLDDDGFSNTSGSVVVTNPGSGQRTLWIRFHVLTTGLTHTYWMPVTLNSGQSTQYDVTGHPGVVSIGITVCDNAIGIVEAPDPVISVAPHAN